MTRTSSLARPAPTGTRVVWEGGTDAEGAIPSAGGGAGGATKIGSGGAGDAGAVAAIVAASSTMRNANRMPMPGLRPHPTSGTAMTSERRGSVRRARRLKTMGAGFTLLVPLSTRAFSRSHGARPASMRTAGHTDACPGDAARSCPVTRTQRAARTRLRRNEGRRAGDSDKGAAVDCVIRRNPWTSSSRRS